jgi:hypothetical protein
MKQISTNLFLSSVIVIIVLGKELRRFVFDSFVFYSETTRLFAREVLSLVVVTKASILMWVFIFHVRCCVLMRISSMVHKFQLEYSLTLCLITSERFSCNCFCTWIIVMRAVPKYVKPTFHYWTFYNSDLDRDLNACKAFCCLVPVFLSYRTIFFSLRPNTLIPSTFY